MMLQRAASNAYSWWLSSHIRTKQSKWLEQNLQDSEEKAQYVLRLLQEEGDSFAKRAEMYYKRRPELISFVEESFKAYRALAERYDKISTELQIANNTIASVCPEHQFELDDDDDDDAKPKFNRKPPDESKGNPPKVPELPKKDLKGMFRAAKKKIQPPKKDLKARGAAKAAKKSGLSKPEAMKEIDKLQKEILVSQTEKEFLKSSYEKGMAKLCEIDTGIKEKQERICSLQDEYSGCVVIEDGEAQKLMATTALNSCQEKLAELQEKKERSIEGAEVERKRIRELRERLMPLTDEFLGNRSQQSLKHETVKSQEQSKVSEHRMNTDPQKTKESESLREKIKERFKDGANADLTVTEMAQKIDELVNKVISLETAISSQTAIVQRSRAEADDLQAQIKILEEDKLTLTDDKSDFRNKLRDIEEKLKGFQDVDRIIEDRSDNLQTHFMEAHCNLDLLYEKLHSVKPNEELEATCVSPAEGLACVELQKESQGESAADLHDGSKKPHNAKAHEEVKTAHTTQRERISKVRFKDQEGNLDNNDASGESRGVKAEAQKDVTAKDEAKLISESQANGASDTISEKQASLPQAVKAGKNKPSETEIKLKNENAMKDEEIQSLRQKLSLLQKGLGDSDDSLEIQQDKPTTITNRKDYTEMKTNQSQTISPTEGQFRTSIDTVLGENLDFLLRFSTCFTRVPKFETGIQDLQADLSNLEEKKKQDGSSTAKYALRSDVRPIFRHLREIQTDMAVWFEKSVLLKEEITSRFSALCSIEAEITRTLEESAEDIDHKFTSHQAAGHQGEILIMKQENNKIKDELQACMDHVTTLQLEVEKTLAKLSEEYALPGTNNGSAVQVHDSDTRSDIPLSSFIFDAKPRKKNRSIFACMHPALYRKAKASS